MALILFSYSSLFWKSCWKKKKNKEEEKNIETDCSPISLLFLPFLLLPGRPTDGPIPWPFTFSSSWRSRRCRLLAPSPRRHFRRHSSPAPSYKASTRAPTKPNPSLYPSLPPPPPLSSSSSVPVDPFPSTTPLAGGPPPLLAWPAPCRTSGAGDRPLRRLRVEAGAEHARDRPRLRRGSTSSCRHHTRIPVAEVGLGHERLHRRNLGELPFLSPAKTLSFTLCTAASMSDRSC